MSGRDASWSTGPKISGIGVASFVTSIAAVALFIGAIVIWTSNPDSVVADTPAAFRLGVVTILSFALALVASALGVVGLFQKEKKKALVILALVFSSPVIAVLVLLVVVGMSAIYV
jgi:hypothetical protein